MFDDLGPLREPLFAARILREEVLLAPLPPDRRSRLHERVLPRNAEDEAEAQALALAARIGVGSDAADGLVVTEAQLASLARELGPRRTVRPRTGPGTGFHGTPAPPAEAVPALMDELLETVNGPVALEVWPAAARAFALHFLLLLVQPFDVPAAPLARAGEALLLAADGFAADRFVLPGRHVAAPERRGRPEPDVFALGRAHRLVESVAETREAVRRETALAVLARWAKQRGAGLNARQEGLLAWLIVADEPFEVPHGVAFADYVELHAGRRAPSLRSLQRDWRGLLDAGWLRPEGDRFVLSQAPLAYEG